MWPWVNFMLASLGLASLVFSDLKSSSATQYTVAFSTHHVEIDGTTLSLNDNELVITGLSNRRILLCFREGRLIFPTLRGLESAKFKVEDGDSLVWTRASWQPAGFLDMLYAPDGYLMTPDQIDLDNSYRFRISKSTSLSSQIRSGMVAKIPYLRLCFVTFALIAILGGLAMVLYLTLGAHFPTPDEPLCTNPEMRQFYRVNFEHRPGNPAGTMFNMEVKRDCQDNQLNWTRYHDRIWECLRHFYPNINQNEWEPWDWFNRGPFFSPVDPPHNCSLPSQ